MTDPNQDDEQTSDSDLPADAPDSPADAPELESDAEGNAEPGETSEPAESSEPPEPGCMPIVIAGTLIMGMVAFIMCGVTTWVLFQKRTEVAIRTLEGYVPVIEQSLLPPDEKKSVIEQLESTKKEMQADEYPQDRASAIMQRLVRLPIPQYGELDAIAAFAEANFEDEQRDNALKQISRVRRAVELGQATVIDVNDVLLPVTRVDTNNKLGRGLSQPLVAEEVRDVIERAKLIGDRGKLPDKLFEREPIDEILRRELAKARSDGGF